MKTTTKQVLSTLFAALLLALCWGLTPGYGQYPQEVLNISAPTHNLRGTTGSWIVPPGGPYKVRITAKGAKGGRSLLYTGGLGAVMSADFIVLSGQVLEVVAGAPGQDFWISVSEGCGGGGGSGVRLSGGAALMVAGGGGGAAGNIAGNSTRGPGEPALLTNTGTQGGAGAPGGGAGGGGLDTPGGNERPDVRGGGAGYDATGGSASTTSTGNGGGGYGGGGGARNGGGGGGGYNGGNGGAYNISVVSVDGGFGGGSYNAGRNQDNSIGNNGGGQVIIALLGEFDFGVTASATQPSCATPTQGGLSLNLAGDIDGNPADVEYAIVAGSPFTGSPTFTDLTADPLNLSSGFGTEGDADGETYTVRVRYKSNPGLFVDKTYTLSSPLLPVVTPGPDRSVIFGYGSNCTAISATATGAATLSYAWNKGAGNGATVSVCPETTTTYEVTVTDGNGCISSPAQVRVNVRDVRCGNRDQNVTICYYGVTQCVSEKIAVRYLKLGATIGGCGTGNARLAAEETSQLPLKLSVTAYPNPVQDAVTVEVLAPTAGRATFEVFDMTGVARQKGTKYLQEGLNEVEFQLGSLPSGVYLIRATDSLNHQGVVRVSKQ